MNNKRSAVMVILDETTNALVLTQRSRHLKSHPGEICFPGGMEELTDQSLYDTALRELHEELAIGADRVHLKEQLREEYTLRGISVQPWLGTISNLIPYTMNEEVINVILIEQKTVLDPHNYVKISVEHRGNYFKTLQFIHNDYFIWGVTARIMHQLVG